MHFEICIEDASGKIFLEHMLPKILNEDEATWRVHGYKGIGRLPKNLTVASNPKKKTLLDKLPTLLRGFARTPGIDAVIIIVDTDDNDCGELLRELNGVVAVTHPVPKVFFRLAIEEMEAWYLGDVLAIKAAYPNAKEAQIQAYVSDSICGTWERLADAIVSGGASKLKTDGWPASGVTKCEWAGRITPHMDVEANSSPSFIKFRDGIRGLVALL